MTIGIIGVTVPLVVLIVWLLCRILGAKDKQQPDICSVCGLSRKECTDKRVPKEVISNVYQFTRRNSVTGLETCCHCGDEISKCQCQVRQYLNAQSGMANPLAHLPPPWPQVLVPVTDAMTAEYAVRLRGYLPPHGPLDCDEDPEEDGLHHDTESKSHEH